MAKPKYKGQSVKEITRDFGLVNLFTKGLGTRIIMIGTISALQFLFFKIVVDQIILKLNHIFIVMSYMPYLAMY
jgi:hypothetical protein